MVTDDQLADIRRQCDELIEGVSSEVLDPEYVRRSLQTIANKKFELGTGRPVWWPGVDSQIEAVSAFLGRYGGGMEGFRACDIPAVPVFVPLTDTEVLLLVVYLPKSGGVSGLYRSFEAWWNSIMLPEGTGKRREDGINTRRRKLRLVEGLEYKPGIRWVAFDPAAYRGLSPLEAIEASGEDGTTLAHIEVLAAAALFPGWVACWDSYELPNLSGLTLDRSPLESVHMTPFFEGADFEDRAMDLRIAESDAADPSWASPTVREC